MDRADRDDETFGGTLKNEITKLIDLAIADAAIDELMTQQETLPATIRELEIQLEGLEGKVTDKKSEITSLESQKKQKEIDLATQRDWINQRENLQKDIKTNKEYHAAVKEITVAKKNITDLEQAITDISASLETETPKISELESEASQSQSGIRQLIEEKKAKIESIASQALTETQKRAEIEKDIPEAILKRYKSIKSKLTPAMTSAEGGCCTECNTRIPPQMFIELQKSQQLITCPRCHRIFYLKS